MPVFETMLKLTLIGYLLHFFLAYCPLGKGTTPLGGGKNVPQSWAPVIDNEDGWVSLKSNFILIQR
jgi:hypothetical protein